MGTYNNNSKNNRKFNKKPTPQRRTISTRKSTTNSYFARTPLANLTFFGKIKEIYIRMLPFLKLLLTLFGVFLLLIVFFGWFDTSRDEENQLKEKINVKYKVVDYFETADPKSPNKVTLQYTILFKDPYTSQEDAESVTSYLRAKYINDAKEKDIYVMLIKADIYKREVLYDKTYLPSDSYVYNLKKSKSETETLDQKKPNYKNYAETLSYTALQLPTTDEVVDELTGELISEGTTGEKLIGEDYYKLLTLLEYKTLLGDIEKAATFYTSYDLKVNVDSTLGSSIVEENSNYIQMYADLGEQTTFLDSEEILWKYYKDNYPKKYQILRKYRLNNKLD